MTYVLHMFPGHIAQSLAKRIRLFMKVIEFAPVAYAEVLDGGLLITFADGTGSFLSTASVHRMIRIAQKLPEFSTRDETDRKSGLNLQRSPTTGGLLAALRKFFGIRPASRWIAVRAK